MKTLLLVSTLLLNGLSAFAQPQRVTFTLKNALGYHRMFRVEGPGIAYGFTMNRNEKTAVNWPVGAKLYFSQDGETTSGLILTVTADDAGKLVPIDGREASRRAQAGYRKPPAPDRPALMVTVKFRNNTGWFRKVALITYKPAETGNGTRIFVLSPYGISRETYPVGTRIYFADDRQVDVVMSGRPLTDTPFLVVQEADHGRTFNISR